VEFRARPLVPGVTRRSAPARICLGEGPCEFKLGTIERRVALENLIFGRTLLKHICNLINSDPGSLDAGLAAPDFRICNDHPSRTLELHQSRSDLVEDLLEIERESAPEKMNLSLRRATSPAVRDDRIVELALALAGELNQFGIQTLR